ncbi:penicillin-binding protein [Candidatus Gracilibacteria bacterium]|nr:penicillin-binding protein [Candidatus Gracilibacteria bacterium]MCF7818991.1 penicillin-binding protein [Candidatus Gracilibacteria bacterium]
MKIRRFHSRRSFFRRLGEWLRLRKPASSWKKRIAWGIGLFFGGLFLYGWLVLPSVDDADQLSFAESTIIYNREALEEGEDPNDHILYVIHGDENREYIPLEEIPESMQQATIAIEDGGFYHHFGFDIGGIIKAGLNYFFGIGNQRGGSTITQQLVKNTFLSRERTLTRKFNELLLAIKMEWYYSKDEILELYLNNIPYGNNAHGIEAASKTFFGKSARELTIAESSILASLPIAPTRFSPYGTNKDLLMGFYEYNEETGEKEYKKGRKDLVLQRMLDLKMITFEEFKQAWAEAKTIEFKQYRTDIKAPHFVFYVREKIEEKYGKEFLKNGGLRIYTTLDPDLQELAEETIQTKSAHYQETYGAKNTALVAVNPDNGQLLAYVGGKDYFDQENDGQVDVLTSRRQPGSSFKPFVYAAAFEQGYTPATVVFDVETDFGGNYQPQNFDGKFLGPVSLRDALNRSLNIPAIKVSYLATPERVLKLAEKLGIKYEGNADIHGVALGIGVAEVEPLSHINAFQVFAGDGSYYEPSAILEVHNSEGEILEKFDPAKTKHEGIDPEIAALLRHVLTDESTRPTTDGFDWNKLLQLENYNNGAKTGTSNRRIENPEFNEEEPEDEDENPKFITAPGDSWTIGFTPHLVSGVWVGNNRGEPMRPGATGLAVAAPIWKKFMSDAHQSLVESGADPEKLYNEPTPLQVRHVNKFSGKIATDFTPPKLVREEVFPSFSVPTELDNSVEQIEIDKISGRPATRYTPFYARTRKYSLTGLQSIKPSMPNWQNPVEEWLQSHPKFLTSLGSIMDEEQETELSPTSPVRDRLISRLPSLQDDVHNRYTQRNAPKIKITSPRNGGIVARGVVEVSVSVSAQFGMKAVEYYFDNKLIADSTQFPWTGRFEIPTNIDFNTQHTIRAVAVDTLFHSSEDEIEVTVAPDQAGPVITFYGPIGQQRIPIHSLVHILVDVKDEASGVKVVEFFVDGKSIGFAEKAPYQKSFFASGDLGRHEISAKAWDFHGNVSERTLPVIYERQKLLQDSNPKIDDIHTYRNSLSVDVIFPEPEQIEWAEIIVDQNAEIIFIQRLTDPPKFAQFQILKNLGGRADIKLITKWKEKADPEQSDVRRIDL